MDQMSQGSEVSQGERGYPPYHLPGFEKVRGKKTGFFHVEKHDGAWWLIDPNGHGFFIVGVDHINYHIHYSEALGYAPYHQSVEQKYGSEEKWAAATGERLRQWGFNTLGANHTKYLRHTHFAHVEWFGAQPFVDIEDLVPRTWWTGFPNVFSPAFPSYCDDLARRVCAANRDDPWLIGYFLDNELQWFGKIEGGSWSNEFGLVEEAWKKPANHTAKQALVELARKRFADIKEFNNAWQTSFDSFGDFAASTELSPPLTPEAQRMARQYVRMAAELYFKGTTEAIRRHDPNHLILGVRFAEWAPDIWDICGEYCDVVSLNNYPTVDIERGVPTSLVDNYRRLYEQAGKPLFITEWSFPALDSGIPCKEAVGMRVVTQKQRARCFRHFLQTLFSLPMVIGSDWYDWADEPILGMSYDMPEDGNAGLVNERDEPWEELTKAAGGLNPQACELHLAGKLDSVYEPVSSPRWTRPVPPMTINDPAAPIKLTTGELELESAGGGRAWNMRYQVRPIGGWQPIILQGSAGDLLAKPEKTTIAAVCEDEEFTVVDMTLSHPGSATVGAFAMAWRFWVPKQSGGWFAAQNLWVENIGAHPWKLAGISYFRRMEGGRSADPGARPAINVSRFYLPMAAWQEDGSGFGPPKVGFGQAIVAMDESLGFGFRREKDGFLSECRQWLDVELPPGARHSGDGSAAIVFGYQGSATAEQLLRLAERAQQVREEARALISPAK